MMLEKRYLLRKASYVVIYLLQPGDKVALPV